MIRHRVSSEGAPPFRTGAWITVPAGARPALKVRAGHIDRIDFTWEG